MDINTAKQALRELQLKMYAYSYASAIVYLDAATVAPKNTSEGRGVAMSVLSGETHKLFCNDEVGALLTFLTEHKDELSDIERRETEVLKRSYDRQTKIPLDVVMEYSKLGVEADDAWHRAKETSDFELFRPYLEKIVEYQKMFAGYYDPSKKPYDALLDTYERGMNTEILDRYFEKVRSAIVPLLAATQAAPEIDDSFLYKYYPVEKQKEFNDWLMEVMGIDRGYCTIGETEHPFTTGTDNRHARITTHYYPEAPSFAMYSTIHEGGHALYELGGDDKYRYTCLAGGVSMGVHESQSRFYENIVGRSEGFTKFIFPKFKEIFPEQLEGVTADMFYRAVNKAQPSLIRTEADELTYSLHIMIRYELEKRIIAGELAVKDIPGEWNRMYKEYLGIDVPSDKEGCLQDSHWSGGSFGYFPSYSLGSAYGAQMLAKMRETVDVDGALAKGDIAPITAWLRERIHRHASFLEPADVVRNACEAEFDPTFYTDYLTEKFTKLYNL